MLEGGDALAEMGFSLFSPEGAKESVVFPTEGGRVDSSR